MNGKIVEYPFQWQRRMNDMASTIIGFSGPRACGKSTIANHLVTNHGYTRIAFADGLREIAAVFENNLAHDRVFLAKLGNKIRELFPQFFLFVVSKKIDAIEGPVIIEDIRFPTEVDYCNRLGTTIRLETDLKTQKSNLEERENLDNFSELVINCEDEHALDLIDLDEWDYVIPAVGDFKELASFIDSLVRGDNLE